MSPRSCRAAKVRTAASDEERNVALCLERVAQTLREIIAAQLLKPVQDSPTLRSTGAVGRPNPELRVDF